MLYNIVLVSAMYQCELATGLHMSALSWTHLPSSSLSHPSGLSCLCHAANSHLLSILHLVMYMFPFYSLNSSHPLLPLLFPQVSSLCLHLHCCPANRFISTIFLDFICTHSYTIFVFLLLTYLTRSNRL